MSRQVDSDVRILCVEPRLFAQMQLLDTIQEAHARVDLTCVSTCGGALCALDLDEMDCLLLSTNLAATEEERRDLASLLRAAGAQGLAVLAVGEAEPGSLGIALHGSLTYEDVALGRLNDILQRAQARAAADRALTALAEQDRWALSARAHGRMLAFTDGLQGERALTPAPVDLERVLERALQLTTTISGLPVEVTRRFDGRLELAVDEALLCQLLLNTALALATWQAAGRVELIASAWCFENELVLELNAPSLQLPAQSGRLLAEPFSVVEGVSGLGLWGARHLLARWGGRVELGTPVGGGTSFLVAFPASLRRGAADDAPAFECA